VLLVVVGVLIGINVFVLLGGGLRPLHHQLKNDVGEFSERLLARQDAFGPGTVIDAAAANALAAGGAAEPEGGSAQLVCLDRPREGGCHSWCVSGREKD